jgi:hypothetical protein
MDELGTVTKLIHVHGASFLDSLTEAEKGFDNVGRMLMICFVAVVFDKMRHEFRSVIEAQLGMWEKALFAFVLERSKFVLVLVTSEVFRDEFVNIACIANADEHPS